MVSLSNHEPPFDELKANGTVSLESIKIKKAVRHFQSA